MPEQQTIAVIGSGLMGAGLGGLFVRRGFRVLSPLEGRSTESRKRAASAGIEHSPMAGLAVADIVLSVVPPAQAVAVARAWASNPSAEARPLFVDANALAPDTKCEIEAIISDARATFADGVIIGAPPHEGYEGPRLYVSGEHAVGASMLRKAGLDVRVLPGPVGAAAALKMCYAGLNKGLTALTTAALLAACRSGSAEALISELRVSQPHLLDRARNGIPHMYPKAYRWIAEFEEIASFTSDDAGTSRLFAAIASFFEDRSEAAKSGIELRSLSAVLKGPSSPTK